MSAVGMWGVMAAFVVAVAAVTGTPGVVAAASPVGVVITSLAVTGTWVHHNRALHARLGPRRAVPAVDTVYELDRRGRLLSLDEHECGSWREVMVYVGATTKRYAGR